jgi:hemoglobin
MGGAPFFTDLVHEFYLGVATDDPLRALYPEADLGPAEVRLRMFLEQYWGGPKTYSEQRGHPRLRQRHVPYLIDAAQRDRWLEHMGSALAIAADRHDLDPELSQQLWTYLTSAAMSLVNAP